MKLRPYQSSGIAAVNACFARGTKRVLAVAPTGAGKGTMATAMIVAAAKRGERVLFVVHRTEIVDDVRQRLAASGCPMRTVTVATVQALARRKRKTYDLVVVDEAHHYRAVEWQRVVESTGKRARMAGFTATPQRNDGKPMGNVFDRLVDVVSYSRLIADGHIVPCRVLMPPQPLGAALALRSVEAYQRYAKGSTALVYERDMRAARASLRAFKAAGIPAAMIVATTEHAERRQAYERLRTGKLKVLINLYVLTEGVDMPWVRTIVLARPCPHAGMYMQIAGRALRPAPGKASALLIDLTGASYLHGEPTVDRVYALRGRRAIGELDDDERVVPVIEPRDNQADDSPPYEQADMRVLGLDLVEFTPELRAKCTRKVWTPYDWDSDGRLGTMPDAKLGLLVGLDETAVTWARKQRGIPSFRESTSTKIDDPRLGLVPDRVIADDWSVSVSTVAKTRERLGIDSFRQQSRPDWSSIPLGENYDRVYAEQLGVDVSTVADARQARGIPAFSADKLVQWDLAKLGLMPDHVYAKTFGVTASAAYYARKRRGIPAFSKTSGIDWSSIPLGENYDRVYAEQLGVSKGTVEKARKARGIPAFDPRTRKRFDAAE